MLVGDPNSVTYSYNYAEYQNFQKLRLLKEHLFGLAQDLLDLPSVYEVTNCVDCHLL